MTIYKNRIEEIEATGRLPSPSRVALAILRLTTDESATLQQLAETLKGDPALSARILDYANSAFSGSRRRIAAVSEAVIRLGVRRVSQVALGFSLVSRNKEGACKNFDYNQFWSTSFLRAVAAKFLSSYVKGVQEEEAFSQALLCQVGRLGLATVHPLRYAGILRRWDGISEGMLCALEEQEFALDHNELTEAMLESWGVPRQYAEAAKYHESLNGQSASLDSAVCQFAQLLLTTHCMARVCVPGRGKRDYFVHFLFSHAERLGVKPGKLPEIFADSVNQWHHWCRVFGIKTGEVPPLREEEKKSAEMAAQIYSKMEMPSTDTNTTAELSPWDAGQEGDQEEGTKAAILGNPQKAEPKEVKILVVDDDPSCVHLITKLLSQQGYDVCPVSDGETALKLAVEVRPHVIITDWKMPGMGGLELCKALRSAEETRRTYVIMLTGLGKEEAQVEALDSGADDYIVKPVQPRTLLARLRSSQRIIEGQMQVDREKNKIQMYASELTIANRRLHEAALRDVLTGLPNRRYALDRLLQEWKRAERNRRNLACMLVDIDHFKQINDTYGHVMGDVVLREVAHRLRLALRKTDVVCRFGGEEFLVICSDTGADAIEVVAESLRSEIESHPVAIQTGKGEKREEYINISIGAACRGADTVSLEVLLKKADKALYRAKDAGRNQVCFAG